MHVMSTRIRWGTRATLLPDFGSARGARYRPSLPPTIPPYPRPLVPSVPSLSRSHGFFGISTVYKLIQQVGTETTESTKDTAAFCGILSSETTGNTEDTVMFLQYFELRN